MTTEERWELERRAGIHRVLVPLIAQAFDAAMKELWGPYLAEVVAREEAAGSDGNSKVPPARASEIDATGQPDTSTQLRRGER